MTKHRSRPAASSRTTAPSARGTAPREASPSPKKGWAAAPFLALGLLVLGAAVFFVAAFEDSTVTTVRDPAPAQDLSPESRSAAKRFPYHDSAEEARPFPVTLPPNTYTNETLRDTYAIAKEIPEVLAQLPCLCGCHAQAEDHGSLLDCYVDHHAAT